MAPKATLRRTRRAHISVMHARIHHRPPGSGQVLLHEQSAPTTPSGPSRMHPHAQKTISHTKRTNLPPGSRSVVAAAPATTPQAHVSACGTVVGATVATLQTGRGERSQSAAMVGKNTPPHIMSSTPSSMPSHGCLDMLATTHTHTLAAPPSTHTHVYLACRVAEMRACLAN